MLVLDAAVDVGETSSDAVLVAPEGGEVDGVGEMGSQELVGLVFQPAPVHGEFREFVGSGGEPFIDGLLDLLGEADVVGVAEDLEEGRTANRR